MSLVEKGMAKAKAMSAARSAASQTSAKHANSISVRPQAPRLQPAERITSRFVRLNAEVCRDNRVLLDEAVDKNVAAVAAYRMLRTRILHRARLKQWTTIGVTSAGPNDGKSLTTLNLALSLAREGNSDIVLLDLDMRSPSICKYLGVEPPAHLRDYFEQRVNLADLFFSIGVENLVIASGTVSTDRASELLGSGPLEALIRHVKEHSASPIVLVDLPPVLSTDDALVVAPRMDAVLLVAAEGRTDRADFSKALELLAEFPLAGLVLNRAVDTAQNYGYGYEPGGG